MTDARPPHPRPAVMPVVGQVWLDVAKSAATKRRHKVTIVFVGEREDPYYCKRSPPSWAVVEYLPPGRRLRHSMQVEPFLDRFQVLA